MSSIWQIIVQVKTEVAAKAMAWRRMRMRPCTFSTQPKQSPCTQSEVTVMRSDKLLQVLLDASTIDSWLLRLTAKGSNAGGRTLGKLMCMRRDHFEARASFLCNTFPLMR